MLLYYVFKSEKIPNRTGLRLITTVGHGIIMVVSYPGPGARQVNEWPAVIDRARVRVQISAAARTSRARARVRNDVARRVIVYAHNKYYMV